MRMEMEERRALAEGRTFEGFGTRRDKTKLYWITFLALFVGLHFLKQWL